MASRVEVHTHGPIFSRAITDAVMSDVDHETEKELADAVYDTVQRNMRRAFKAPRPYYWTRVTKERSGAGWEVHDTGIIYGPWLEGTGSRNQTTRFKGYAHWRRAAATVNQRARMIGNRVLRRRIGRLGG